MKLKFLRHKERQKKSNCAQFYFQAFLHALTLGLITGGKGGEFPVLADEKKLLILKNHMDAPLSDRKSLKKHLI